MLKYVGNFTRQVNDSRACVNSIIPLSDEKLNKVSIVHRSGESSSDY